MSDGVRVNPVTGAVFEARPDIHKDTARGSRRGNSVWSRRPNECEFAPPGTSRRISGESRDGFKTDERGVHISALKGPAGASIDRPNVAVFKEWYVNVRSATTGYERTSLGPGWYPDALMPERRGTVYRFSVLDSGPVQQHSRSKESGHLVRYIRSRTIAARTARKVHRRHRGHMERRTRNRYRCCSTSGISRCPRDAPAGRHLERVHAEDAAQRGDGVLPARPAAPVFPADLCLPAGASIKGPKVTLDWTEYDRRLVRISMARHSRKSTDTGAGLGLPSTT